MSQSITLILAHDEAGAIGAGDGLPWPRIPEDMKHFRDHTRGRPVIMGRKTMETLGRPLPWRHNIVLTRDPEWKMDHVTTASTIDAAIKSAGDAKEIMVIGGADTYRQFMPVATRMLVTEVAGRHEGDTFWKPDLMGWKEESRQEVKRNGSLVCTFITYKQDK